MNKIKNNDETIILENSINGENLIIEVIEGENYHQKQSFIVLIADGLYICGKKKSFALYTNVTMINALYS